MTEALWRGSFGAAYLERNKDAGADRRPFWRSLQQQFPFTSLLEVGCNAGQNLQWIVNRKTGIDVNAAALAIAQQRCPTADLRVAEVTLLPFADRTFECVLSCGVLIHVPPAVLPKAMDEMWRTSSKYLMVMEYHSVEETEVEYRGQRGALWTRPYARLFSERFALTDVARGYAGKDRGFDGVHWNLWRKR